MGNAIIRIQALLFVGLLSSSLYAQSASTSSTSTSSQESSQQSSTLPYFNKNNAIERDIKKAQKKKINSNGFKGIDPIFSPPAPGEDNGPPLERSRKDTYPQ